MAARRRFLFDAHQVTAYRRKFDTIPTNLLTLELLQAKGQELERRWTKASESYLESILEDDKAEERDFTDVYTPKYEEAEEDYMACKSRITFLMKEHNSREPLPVPTHASRNAPPPPLKLPPCDTPNFEGGYSKWPSFRDIFMAVYGTHEN